MAPTRNLDSTLEEATALDVVIPTDLAVRRLTYAMTMMA